MIDLAKQIAFVSTTMDNKIYKSLGGKDDKAELMETGKEYMSSTLIV